MDTANFERKLREVSYYQIIFSRHAELRLTQRQIDKETVMGHLRNPEPLKIVERLRAREKGEKYKLWFIPHRRIAYIYVVVINNARECIIVVTVIKQRLNWQKRVKKYAG